MRASLQKLSENLIYYIKIVLIVLLITIELVVCAQAAGDFLDTSKWYNLLTVALCCSALAVVEGVDTFVVKKFNAKMACYGVDSALLLVICIFMGNSFLSVLYCVVLTQMYISIERFRDKAVLFGVSCGLYTISFIVGWVLSHPDASQYSYALEIISGSLFGLLAIALDFVIVLFLLSFYKTNRELSAALKEADESKAQLKEMYEKLSETAVYEERNRIAKDIHDNAGHSMTTVIMQTEAAKLLMDKDPEEAKSRIISANIQARNALEQMRESVHLLAGRRINRSLKEEVQEIIAQTIDGTDIKVRYDLDEVQPSEEGYRFICNSVKECLANGIRHGRATAFYIELKDEGGKITLYISDNGGGAEGEIVPGFGLKSIRAKAEALGGGCEFFSEKGEGFEVNITLPISTAVQNG